MHAYRFPCFFRFFVLFCVVLFSCLGGGESCPCLCTWDFPLLRRWGWCLDRGFDLVACVEGVNGGCGGCGECDMRGGVGGVAFGLVCPLGGVGEGCGGILKS